MNKLLCNHIHFRKMQCIAHEQGERKQTRGKQHYHRGHGFHLKRAIQTARLILGGQLLLQTIRTQAIGHARGGRQHIGQIIAPASPVLSAAATSKAGTARLAHLLPHGRLKRQQTRPHCLLAGITHVTPGTDFIARALAAGAIAAALIQLALADTGRDHAHASFFHAARMASHSASQQAFCADGNQLASNPFLTSCTISSADKASA